jgi:hypothetical protein
MPSRNEYHPVERELILIGGPYKSGTSRLCESIEELGYRNPAFTTNSGEYGHGTAVPHYLTRECAVARTLNRRLIGAVTSDKDAIGQEILNYLVEMFQHAGPKLVLKDPYMKLTAVHWCEAARDSGIRNLHILITVRARAPTVASWSKSRFLTREMHKHSSEFRYLLRPMSQATSNQLRNFGAKLTEISYSAACSREDLLSTKNAFNFTRRGVHQLSH